MNTNYRLPPYQSCSNVFSPICQSHYNKDHDGLLTFNLIATSSVGVTSSLDSYVVGDCVYKLQTDVSGSPILTNKSKCEQIGWNACNAEYPWYGSYPYLHPDDGCPTGICGTIEEGLFFPVYEANYYSPYTDKYLNSSVEGGITTYATSAFDPNLCPYQPDREMNTYSASFYTTQNRHTGQYITTGGKTYASSSTGNTGSADGLLTQWQDWTTTIPGSRCAIISKFIDYFSTYVQGQGWEQDYFACSSASFHKVVGTDATNVLTYAVSDTACSFAFSYYSSLYPDDFDNHGYSFQSETSDVTPLNVVSSKTTLQRIRDYFICDNPDNCFCDFIGDEVNLSAILNLDTANSLDSCVADAEALLDTVDLTNLIAHPLRTDLNFNLNPLISIKQYYEISPGISGSGIGSKLGTPLPDYVSYSGSLKRAWFDQYYDKDHINCDGSTTTWDCFTYPSGAYSPSVIHSATQWTSDQDSNCLFGIAQVHGAIHTHKGAFLDTSDKCKVRKYQETLVYKYPSHNWLEPFSQSYYSTLKGKDQDCGIGDKLDITYTISGSHFIGTCGDTGSYLNPCGGLYYPTTNSYNPFWNDERKKYEFVDGKWETCDRVALENARAYPEGRATCSVCLTREDSSHYTSSKTSGSQSYGVYNPCKANTYYVGTQITGSKNEVNAKYFTLPLDTFKDGRYGSVSVRDIVQIIPDPLYQTPNKPCGLEEGCDSLEWIKDGTWNFYTPNYNLCKDDFVDINGVCYKFYPLPPFVEARITPPTDTCFGSGSAPALPINATQFDINTYKPIAQDDKELYVNPPIPFFLYLKQKSCVQSNGHFAEIYSKNIGVPVEYPI